LWWRCSARSLSSSFQERIPALTKALLDKIQTAHKRNPPFKVAFYGMMELYRSALNPNISIAAVDEMLVQHLLTERLFDSVRPCLKFRSLSTMLQGIRGENLAPYGFTAR